MQAAARSRVRALVAWALAFASLCSALPPVAGAGPRPMAIDFSGDGAVTDAGTFGVFGAAVEVTLWASTGIAAGPLQLTAGAVGAYAWSFSQAPQASLVNITIRAWLPWDPNVSAALVFDVSNATPQVAYPGEDVALPFAATETLDLVLPAAGLVLPRGRQVTVEFVLANKGNVSVAHTGFNLSLSSAAATGAFVNASASLVEERPATPFGVNATFSAPAAAPVGNLTGTFAVVSTSGTNFSFPFSLRIAPNRNAAVVGVDTVPQPPDEARAGDIVVHLENRGTDAAPAVSVQVQATYASLPDVYLNSTSVALAPGGSGTASFGWTPLWSPDAVTVVATAAVADDWDLQDDSDTAVFLVNSTNLAPSVSFTSPTDGARIAGNITVSGTAEDPEAGPLTLTVTLDGGALLFSASATAFGFVLDLAPLPDGPHALEARAVDNRSLVGVARANITVLNGGPNAPPSVALVAPRDGDTVGASFQVRGTASDERGGLSAVLISVDGGPETPATGTSSWVLALNGSALGEGPHHIEVRAFDSIDYSAPATLDLHVNATPPSAILISGVAVAPTPSEPSAQVTVSGNAAFDTLVLAAGATVSVQVRGFVDISTAVTDVRGHFAVQVTSPSAAGDYTVDIAVVSAGLQAGTTAPLTVSTATLPDLELLPTGFAVDPDPAPPQTPIHHTIEVLNNGAVTANATIRVWDGLRGAANLIFEWRFTITSSRQAAFDHTYAAGTHNLTIALEEVDPQDADLSDNQMVIEVSVPEAPDFAVESVMPSTTDIREGFNITFLVVVHNLATTPGFVLIELWDGEPLAPNSTKIHDERVGVAADARERLLFTWAPTAGEHRIVAQAVLAAPAELVLTNNRANVTVTVPPATVPPEPTFLPGFGGFGAAAAAAAVGAAKSKRKVAGPRRPRALAAAVALLLAAGIGAALIPGPTAADLPDAGAMQGPLRGVCATCHTNPQGGGPLNPFGADYWDARNESGGSANWTALGALDSDGDLTTNEAEWRDSYLPGDPNSNPRTGIRYSGFGGGGVSGILTGVIAVIAVSLTGVGLGVYMLKKRNARLEAKPPAPKP